jgi:hypothetical protein
VAEAGGGRMEESERMVERALVTDSHQEGGGFGLELLVGVRLRASVAREEAEVADEVVGDGDPPLAAIWSRR